MSLARARRVVKHGQIITAIVGALDRKVDYPNHYDKAIAIKVDLKKAGFQIIYKRGAK